VDILAEFKIGCGHLSRRVKSNIHIPVPPQPRIEREKTDCVVDAFQKYSSDEISKDHYVRSVGFRHRANTEM
jgi:hypothetical protein